MLEAATTSRTLWSLIRATTGLGSVREGETVGHAGDVVGDPVGELALAGRQQLGIVDEPREDRLHDVVRAPVLGPDLGPEIDAIEHERAKREHRLADLVALLDVARPLGGLDEVVDEPVDPLRAGRAEELDLGARQVASRRGCRSESRRRCRG